MVYNILEEFQQKPKRDVIALFRNTTFANIESKLKQYLPEWGEELEIGNIGISFHDLKGKFSDFDYNSTKPIWSASTIKLPIMMTTIKAIEERKLSYWEKLTINHKFGLETYDPVSMMPFGSEINVIDLLRYMIINSDNEATNMLANKIGLFYINQTIKKYGVERTMLAHLLTPNVPRLTCHWNKDGSNLTCANDLVKLITKVYTNEVATYGNSNIMKLLLENNSGGNIRRYLPLKTRVGQKNGYITDMEKGSDLLEVGVVNNDYAIAVTCNKIKPYGIIDYNYLELMMELESYPFKRFEHSTLFKKLDCPDEESQLISTISWLFYEMYYKGTIK